MNSQLIHKPGALFMYTRSNGKTIPRLIIKEQLFVKDSKIRINVV